MSVYSLHFSNQLGTLKHLKCPDHVVSRQSTIPGGGRARQHQPWHSRSGVVPGGSTEEQVTTGCLEVGFMAGRRAGQGRAGQQTRPEAAAGWKACWRYHQTSHRLSILGMDKETFSLFKTEWEVTWYEFNKLGSLWIVIISSNQPQVVHAMQGLRNFLCSTGSQLVHHVAIKAGAEYSYLSEMSWGLDKIC